MSASPQQQDNLEILAFGQTTVSKFKKLKIFLYGLKGVSKPKQNFYIFLFKIT